MDGLLFSEVGTPMQPGESNLLTTDIANSGAARFLPGIEGLDKLYWRLAKGNFRASALERTKVSRAGAEALAYRAIFLGACSRVICPSEAARLSVAHAAAGHEGPPKLTVIPRFFVQQRGVPS